MEFMNSSAAAIEVRHLHLVAAVAREGSLTRAASHLHLTQSAVSCQLRDLEDRLGVPLFRRSTRQMQITDAGRCMMESAKRILGDIETLEREVRRLGDHQKTQIRIATECYTSYHWLPAVLRELAPSLPRLEAQVVLEATHHPLAALLAGNLEIAICLEQPRRTQFRVLPLFTDEILLMVSPGHPLAARQYVEPRHLEGEHLITYDLPLEQLTVYQKFLRPANVTPRISRMPLTEAILEMVKAGMGVCAMAGWAAAPMLSEGSICGVHLTRRGIKRQWCVATLPASPLRAESDAFAQALSRWAAANKPR